LPQPQAAAIVNATTNRHILASSGHGVSRGSLSQAPAPFLAIDLARSTLRLTFRMIGGQRYFTLAQPPKSHCRSGFHPLKALVRPQT